MSYPFSNQFDTSDFMDESQQQQLSPMTGHGYPQWETIERGEQQQQQHRIESPLDTSMDSSTTPTGPTPIAFRSINIEMMDEMSRNIMPSSAAQIDNTPITLHHPHVLHQHHLQQQHHQQQQQQFLQQQQYQQSRHPSVEPFSTHSSRPGSSQLHVVTSPTDIFRPQSTTPLTPNPTTEPSGPSTSNTAAGRRGTTSRKTSGPVRSSGRVTRSQQQAPYYRQSPASGTAASFLGVEVPPHAGSSSSTSSTPRVPQQAEPTPRKQTVRFTAVTTAPTPTIQTRAASRAAASSMMSLPVVPEIPESAAT